MKTEKEKRKTQDCPPFSHPPIIITIITIIAGNKNKDKNKSQAPHPRGKEKKRKEKKTNPNPELSHLPPPR